MAVPFAAACSSLTCSLLRPSLLRLLTTLSCEVSVSCRNSSQLALVGLCYFVLPWRWLGPVWALAPFQRCFALLARSWSYPFGSLGSVAFLQCSSLSLLAHLFWLGVLCLLCVLRVLCGCVRCTYRSGALAFAAAFVLFWGFRLGCFVLLPNFCLRRRCV